MISAAEREARHNLTMVWVAQMAGTIVLASVVLIYVNTAGAPFATDGESPWLRYAMMGIVVGIAPALLYLGTFKARLDAHEAAVRRQGAVNPGLRDLVVKSLAIGGALCELPMAMGVVQLFFGGGTRWFLGATLVTIALRLSYRPFTRQ